MAFDFYAACNGLAARYAPGTIATPAGEVAMRAAYGQSPNNIAVTPCVVVYPQDGDLVYGSGTKDGEYRLDVQFYLQKASGDYPRMETSRQRWLVPLLGATDGQMKLGQAAPVAKAIPTTWEFNQPTYGDDTYDGILLHVTIFTTAEPVTLAP